MTIELISAFTIVYYSDKFCSLDSLLNKSLWINFVDSAHILPGKSCLKDIKANKFKNINEVLRKILE